MARRLDLAVVGASSVIGAAILDQLDARDFPAEVVHALDCGPSPGSTVHFGHHELAVREVQSFDFTQVALALFVGDSSLAREQVPRALAAGCAVIDLSAQFRSDPNVPLIVPELNKDQINASNRLIALPGPASVALAMVLQPLQAVAGLARVNVVSLHPVSDAGQPAIEELGKQTADLLSFRDIRRQVFPAQIAFNTLPQVDVFLGAGQTQTEQDVEAETRRLLGLPQLPINVTALRVPVFYGVALAIQLETCEKLPVEQAVALLAQAPGLAVLNDLRDGGYPTAVSHASGDDAVHVGRIREDRSHPRGLNLWVVTDNLRKGSALNATQVAEILVRDYL